jgi:hypothetical protein
MSTFFQFWILEHFRFQIWDAQSVKPMQIFQNLKKLPKVWPIKEEIHW